MGEYHSTCRRLSLWLEPSKSGRKLSLSPTQRKVGVAEKIINPGLRFKIFRRRVGYQYQLNKLG